MTRSLLHSSPLVKLLSIRRRSVKAAQLTIDVQTFTNSTLRSYFQFEGATFNQNKPGVQYLVGLRGTF